MAVAVAAQEAPVLDTPAPTAPASAPVPVAEVPPVAPGPDLASLTQRFTQLATRHLGLLESYRMVLEIERCASVAELRALAPRLEVVDVGGAGHMVAGDRNDVFGKGVIEFLGRHMPPSGH